MSIRGRLADPGASEEPVDLSCLHRHGEGIDGRLVAEALAEILRGDRWSGRGSSHPSPSYSAMLCYSGNMETSPSARLNVITLGSRVTVDVLHSEVLAVAALLPMMDGGALSGEEDLLQVPGWKTARALLVHGLVLRDELTEMSMAGSPDLPDASKMAAWITERPPVWWRSLLARGAHDGLTYYSRHMAPVAAVESVISTWPNGIPSRAELMSDRQLWREAVTAQVQTWPESDSVLGTFLDVSSRLAACVATAWTLAARSHGESGMGVATPSFPQGMSAVDALRQMTGRTVPEDARASLEGKSRFVFIPTPALGGQILTTTFRDVVVAWGEVAPSDVPGQRMKDVMTAFDALGSEVNRRILMALSGASPLGAQVLAEQLSLHPSTISRHLPVLIEANLVEPVADVGHITYRPDTSGVRLMRSWLDSLSH